MTTTPTPTAPSFLHLLPPHIKLQIIAKINKQTHIQPQTQSGTTTASTGAARSTQQVTAASSPPPSTFFSSPPLFDLSVLQDSALSLPTPFTVSALTLLHTHGYCLIDDYLSSVLSCAAPTPQQIQAQVQRLLHSGELQPGGMKAAQTLSPTATPSTWIEGSIRGDRMCWLSNDSTTHNSSSSSPSSNSCFTTIMRALNKTIAGLSCLSAEFPITPSSTQLAVYNHVGSRYVRHRDTHSKGPQRKLTCIYYCNDNWQEADGGQLRLYLPQGPAAADTADMAAAVVFETSVDVSPVYDRLLLFVSPEVEHEVLPSYKQRIALTTWFK